MKTIINLFGPSTAGKSTVADLLQNRIDNLQTIDFDTIKRQIPNYDWSKHAQEGRNMTLEKLAAQTQVELPMLLIMPSPKNEAEFARISSIAQTNSYELINIEITAPNDVLIDRYKHRLANIDPTKSDWKFKTLDEFKTKLQEPYYRPPSTTTFETPLQNSDEIVDAVIKLVQKAA